jgi:hypothetical protein
MIRGIDSRCTHFAGLTCSFASKDPSIFEDCLDLKLLVLAHLKFIVIQRHVDATLCRDCF